MINSLHFVVHKSNIRYSNKLSAVALLTSEILADTSQLSEQCSTASGTMVGTLFGGFAGGIILTVAVVAILRRVSKGKFLFNCMLACSQQQF